MRLIAPAGPFDRTLFWRGAGFLAQTFRVRWSRQIFSRHGFLAGSSEARLMDLRAALECPETRLIVCARGGVGCTDLLDEAALERWAPRDAPFKWLVGFSDVTALHARWQQLGLPSIHASNVTSLGVGCAALREQWLSHVLNPFQAQRWTLQTLYGGSASGPLVGGNLAVLHDLCAARRWSPPAGCVLFLEEIAEPPYRIYRMLTALHRGGYLRHVAGLVVGQITSSNPGVHRTSAREVFTELCARWQLPAAWGLPAGHVVGENHPLTFGCTAHLDASERHTTFTLAGP